MATPDEPETRRNTVATEMAQGIALQAGNYSRAVRGGTPHDASEIRRLSAAVLNLLDVLSGQDHVGASGSIPG